MQQMGVQDKKRTLNCAGKLVVLNLPAVFGILNITPDSFYDGGKHKPINAALKQVEKMLKEGADVIDIGAQSTRPGASQVSAGEEMLRLLPTITSIKKEFPEAIISVDTFQSSVAKEAISEGAAIVNDVSGGSIDSNMFSTIAQLKVPYVLMHMQGTPDNMQKKPNYKNGVVEEVLKFFENKLNQLHTVGVHDVIIDPGFGFGKTLEHNYMLLQQLSKFKFFDCMIMAGTSRKSMINKLIGTQPTNALNGTTVANTIALMNGANILRVHDVKQAREAIKIVDYMKNV